MNMELVRGEDNCQFLLHHEQSVGESSWYSYYESFSNIYTIPGNSSQQASAVAGGL